MDTLKKIFNKGKNTPTSNSTFYISPILEQTEEVRKKNSEKNENIKDKKLDTNSPKMGKSH